MSGYANIIAAIIGFGLTALLGIVLIPMLRKLKFGQTIREDGPTWHKGKQGTPTMGGLMFIIGVIAAVVTGYIILRINTGTGLVGDTLASDMRLWAGLFMAVAFGFVGFVDDYIKVAKKRNLGLTAKQKLVMQFLIAAAYLACLYLSGDTSTMVIIPFIGQIRFGTVLLSAGSVVYCVCCECGQFNRWNRRVGKLCYFCCIHCFFDYMQYSQFNKNEFAGSITGGRLFGIFGMEFSSC